MLSALIAALRHAFVFKASRTMAGQTQAQVVAGFVFCSIGQKHVVGIVETELWKDRQ